MPADSAPEPAETWALPTRHLGRRVHVYPRLDSTNTHALALAGDPTSDGLAILAREQSAGRGQHGRTWTAPAGSSVLLSVLLFPPPPLRRPALLTAWAAVAVGETVLALTGEQARIKWPNDVLLRGRKVCGILIEQRGRGDASAPPATVVGIGLNVTQPAAEFAEAKLPLAGSLASVTGRTLATDDVARRLLTQLDDEYDRLVQGDFATLEALWKWRLGLLGRQVVVEGIAGDDCRGRLLDVTLDEIELEVAPGDVRRLVPEAVRHITPA
jgi:BirA family biotin operon repressor/biotin-[acetyl-CoA-carboxylase] ligase